MPRKTLREMLYRESPIKRGVVIVDDEDETLRDVDKIMPRLYLGNAKSAKSAELFKKINLKAVLNCTRNLPNTFRNEPSVEYMRIPIEDSLKQVDFEKAFNFMPAAVEFIHKQIDLEKKNVLIHCFAGRQRSAIMVAAYLCKYHRMTPIKACLFINSKRPEAFHYGKSLNFDTSLEKYYKTL